MRFQSIEDYDTAYDVLCKAAKCKSFEIYDDCVIAVFKHSNDAADTRKMKNGYAADEWNFLHLNNNITSFVECNEINTERKWRMLQDGSMKKFIVDVILESSKAGDVTVRMPGLPLKPTITVMKRGMTLENLLIEADLERCA